MLPNLIIIGAMKSGTTSLHSYLDIHPQITMSQIKETDFFVAEKNWPKGIEWYQSNFIGKAKILGESSPNYTKCHIFAGVPRRMHSVLPETKLVYILRDPVARIISHYMHNYHEGNERRNISKALTNLENNHYVLCSKYYMQLEQYLSYFPQSNILVITLEDLSNLRQHTLQKVLKFLEVDGSFYIQGSYQALHQSSDKKQRTLIGMFLSKLPGKNLVKPFFLSHFGKIYYSISYSKIRKPTLGKRLKQKLIGYLQEDVNNLRKYTGHNFKDWCL